MFSFLLEGEAGRDVTELTNEHAAFTTIAYKCSVSIFRIYLFICTVKLHLVFFSIFGV